MRKLAGRDSSPMPEGDVLGLELGGRLLAMLPLGEGAEVIADPFARTDELRALLELRGAQLRARAAHAAVAEIPGAQPARRLDPVALFARAS